MMFTDLKTIKEIMEDVREQEIFYDEEFSIDIRSYKERDYPSILQRYNMKNVGRHLIIVDGVGGIYKEFEGYAPLNGGNVLYMETY